MTTDPDYRQIEALMRERGTKGTPITGNELHPFPTFINPDPACLAAADAIAALRAERDAAVAFARKYKAFTLDTWDYRPLPEDAAIMAAHPLNDKNPDAGKRYVEAMRLVGAKRGKHALCELVNWLLARIAALTAERDALREAIRDLSRAARSLLDRNNIHNMPEGESVQWQQLADAALRARASLGDAKP